MDVIKEKIKVDDLNLLSVGFLELLGHDFPSQRQIDKVQKLLEPLLMHPTMKNELQFFLQNKTEKII